MSAKLTLRCCQALMAMSILMGKAAALKLLFGKIERAIIGDALMRRLP